jgi:hypothetical protein
MSYAIQRSTQLSAERAEARRQNIKRAYRNWLIINILTVTLR